jgi:TrmH family RNA methyltransferase
LISKNRLKYLVSLKQKKYREREHKFIVEGIRLCEELLGSDFAIEQFLFCPSLADSNRASTFIEKCEQKRIPIEEVSRDFLKRIADTVNPQGIIGIAHKPQITFEQFIQSPPQNILAVIDIKEPGNLGAISRSASWFGIDALLLSPDSVDFTNPKVVRASMGALFHMSIFDNISLLENLAVFKNMGYTTFLADTHAENPYYDATFQLQNVLIFGGETAEISHEIKDNVDARIRIPRIGKGDSLNVAVAAGIIMSELKRKKHFE